MTEMMPEAGLFVAIEVQFVFAGFTEVLFM
jgi:hypothetical protein